MELTLKDIMAISGYPGLFKFVSQGRQGIIVESLIDGKRMTAAASPTTSKITTLADVSIFSTNGDVSLRDVLKKIRENANGAATIDPKSDSKTLKDYFAQVLPDYDRERVYDSHIKKIISWYNLLQSKDLLHLLDISDEANASDVAQNAATDNGTTNADK